METTSAALPAWYARIKESFGTSIITERLSAPGEIEITVSAERSHELLAALKTLADGPFEHLADLTAYDHVPVIPRFRMVYELISMIRKERCAVIVPVMGEPPSIRTISDLWSGANWLEREVYDMFGVGFEGHPDLRRMLLPEGFKGYPLRKDFIVDYRQTFAIESDGSDLFDPFGNTIVQTAEE